MKINSGFLFAISAYAWWGIIPIFWKQLDHVDAIEIVAHRMVWAFLFVLALILLLGQGREFSRYLKDPGLLVRLFIASFLMSLNWAVFIWAVNTDRLVETSMGYFMNPLISVAAGVIFFSEKLRRAQTIAILIAVVGVVTLVVNYRELPLVALTLAITFSLYSVIKKTVSVPAIHGMAIETLFMFFPGLVYLFYLSNLARASFGLEATTDGLLILCGLFTLIPLTLFAMAATRIRLVALGMSQYFAPFLQLGIGVFIYNEPFGSERLLAFSLIWVALTIYSIDQVLVHRINRRKISHLPS